MIKLLWHSSYYDKLSHIPACFNLARVFFGGTDCVLVHDEPMQEGPLGTTIIQITK